jgi:N-acetylmuramoyl-L-alanine amidase
MEALGITTDDEVEVIVPAPGVVAVPSTIQIAMSSGHGLKIRGASGFLDEVNEARRVVAEVHKIMTARGITCHTFNDDTSTTQQKNLETIVNWHNKQKRNLDISVHFNAYQQTSTPMGTECLYLTQQDLAARVSSLVAQQGELVNRGAKKRTNLYFLNKTNKPAILIEVCFVDSSADAEAYKKNFEKICTAIVDTVI